MDARLETGSYVLRDLLRNVALSAEQDDDNVRITCVELWGKRRGSWDHSCSDS